MAAALGHEDAQGLRSVALLEHVSRRRDRRHAPRPAGDEGHCRRLCLGACPDQRPRTDMHDTGHTTTHCMQRTQPGEFASSKIWISTGQTFWHRSQRIHASRSTAICRALHRLRGDQKAPRGQIQRQNGRRVMAIQTRNKPSRSWSIIWPETGEPSLVLGSCRDLPPLCCLPFNHLPFCGDSSWNRYAFSDRLLSYLLQLG